MQIERKHFLLFVAIFVLSVFGWGGSLYIFTQLSLDLKWLFFCLFFGSCIVAAVIGWQIENIIKLFKKRHATKRRANLSERFNRFRKFKRGSVVVDPPAVNYSQSVFSPEKLGINYMQQKLAELKHLSVKGLDNE